MSNGIKKVNVYPTIPIHGLAYPITSACMAIDLPVGDIRVCLCKGAKVEEIIEKNRTIRLNLSNFDKDNTPKTIQTQRDALKNTEPVNPIYVPPDPQKPVVDTENTNPSEVKDDSVKDVTGQVKPDTFKKVNEKINEIKK